MGFGGVPLSHIKSSTNVLVGEENPTNESVINSFRCILDAIFREEKTTRFYFNIYIIWMLNIKYILD